VKPPKDIGDNSGSRALFKTIPTSHTICFTCHNADSGIAPEPKNCETCHKLAHVTPPKTDFDAKLAPTMGADALMFARWSRRQSAGAFAAKRHAPGPELHGLSQRRHLDLQHDRSEDDEGCGEIVRRR
jgi:hypothetical protein